MTATVMRNGKRVAMPGTKSSGGSSGGSGGGFTGTPLTTAQKQSGVRIERTTDSQGNASYSDPMSQEDVLRSVDKVPTQDIAGIMQKMNEKIQLGLDGKPKTVETPASKAMVQTPPAGTTQSQTPAPTPDIITDPVTQQQFSRTSPTGTYSPYQQAFQQAKQSGLPAPVDSATGAAMTKGMTPPPAPVDYTTQLTETDPNFQAMQKAYDDFFSPKNQKDSLVKEYQRMMKQSGIEELDTDLINMGNIIEGSEDDIRNEVTKAGGFATDSQVLALTNSRNKQLIKNYNTLLETRNAKQKYLDTMIGLAAQDKQLAGQQFDRQMNFMEQKMNYADKAKTFAQNSFNKIVDQVGYKGLYDQASKGGEYGIALAEDSLGLSRGGLLALANQPMGLKDQLLTEQIKTEQAQRSKIYKDIEKINSDIDASNADYGEWDALVGGAGNLVASTKKDSTRQQIGNALKKGDYTNAYAGIANAVEDGLTGTSKTLFADSRTDYSVLGGLRDAVQQYADGGGDMGLLKGTAEEIQRKLGVDSGDASVLATQLWREFQMYRSNMTGAAFSPGESRDYAAVNPTLGKSLDLNLSVIEGAQRQLENRITSTINTRLPEAQKVWDKVNGTTDTTTPQPFTITLPGGKTLDLTSFEQN